MNLLVTMKLSDRSMLNHIYPITLLDEVEKIIIVRDTKGPKIDKVYYYCPPDWTRRMPFIGFLYKFLIMINISIKEKPQLIHGYLLFPHGILAFIIGILTKKRVGISLIAGPVELYSPVRDSIGKYPYCKPLPPLNTTAKILLYLLNKCDIVTVAGTYTKKFLVTNGVQEKKIYILPHIVDTNFKPKHIAKNYDVIFVGRLAPVKHVEVLIKSIELARNNFKKIKVAVVGDGECKEKLETLSKKLKLTDNIFFLGHQTDVWTLYNKAKVSVLTSEREGFPYSVIESLSCGIPVISSSCGNVTDILKNEYNGYVINDYQDHVKFAEAILKLTQEPGSLSEFSKNALKSVQQITRKDVAIIWRNILSSI